MCSYVDRICKFCCSIIIGIFVSIPAHVIAVAAIVARSCDSMWTAAVQAENTAFHPIIHSQMTPTLYQRSMHTDIACLGDVHPIKEI